MQKMKFIVLSDSHGREDGMRRVLSANRDADGFFFLGDGAREAAALAEEFPSLCFLGVRGNCDSPLLSFLGRATLPEEDEIVLMGHRILYLHGHTAGAKSGLGALISLGRRRGASLVLFGHTHEPCEHYIADTDPPLYLFNPGSISRPRSGGQSFGVLTLTDGGILLSHGTLEH